LPVAARRGYSVLATVGLAAKPTGRPSPGLLRGHRTTTALLGGHHAR